VLVSGEHFITIVERLFRVHGGPTRSPAAQDSRAPASLEAGTSVLRFGPD
jgi:hypothetical protein